MIPLIPSTKPGVKGRIYQFKGISDLCISGKNWIDISQFSSEDEYLDSNEVYTALADYLTESLADDEGFSKILYKYMPHEDTISGAQLCMLLYDQNVLEKDDATYQALKSGSMRAYDFMINKIRNLEITPAQLALEFCSGSVVITDVNTGETPGLCDLSWI